MNAHDDLDRRLVAALVDGPSRAPERSIAAALDHARAHPRRRDPLAILRRDPMNTRSSRFAVALQPLSLIVILALVMAATFAALTVGGLFQDRPVVLPSIATPSPAPVPTPGPTPSPAWSSPATASPTTITVDLIDAVGADATIDVLDLSGTLVGAVSGNPPDGASDLRVTALEGSPATIILTWGGMPCDTTHLLTIEPDGLTMTIERPACQGDALGISHALVLTFDHPVDPAKVDVTVRTTGG